MAKNLANVLSLTRLVMIVPIVWLHQTDSATALFVAAGLMLLSELTDIADGVVARRYSGVTDFGKLVDPMADSLYRASVFISFLAAGWMPLWLLLPIVWRDTVVAYIRILAAKSGVVMAARTSGKIKAILQAIAQIAVVVLAGWAATGFDGPWIEPTILGLLTVASLYTAYSGFDYAIGGARDIRAANVAAA